MEEQKKVSKQIYFKQFHGIPIFIMHSFLKTGLCRYRRLYNLLTQMGPFLLVLMMPKKIRVHMIGRGLREIGFKVFRIFQAKNILTGYTRMKKPKKMRISNNFLWKKSFKKIWNWPMH